MSRWQRGGREVGAERNLRNEKKRLLRLTLRAAFRELVRLTRSMLPHQCENIKIRLLCGHTCSLTLHQWAVLRIMLACFRVSRSPIASWRWPRSHWGSSLMPSWPAKTWTPRGKRPSTRSSANWTARSPRSSSRPIVSKSFYMSKFLLLLLASLLCAFDFVEFENHALLWFSSHFFSICLIPCLILNLFLLNVWNLWSSIPNLWQFLKDLAIVLLLWYSMINILDYNLCCFSMIMNWRDTNLWGVFFSFLFLGDCVNPPLNPKSSVSQMGGKSSILHNLGWVPYRHSGSPSNPLGAQQTELLLMSLTGHVLPHTHKHTCTENKVECGYWLEQDWTPSTGLYWSVDLGLVSTDTLSCFKVFCNEGIVWLYNIILTIIIIVVVIHDYYLSSLFA